MSLIVNETLKLQANALDRSSTACLTVGVLAPLAAFLYGFPEAGRDLLLLGIGALIWLLASFALHLLARRTLKGLLQ